MSLRRAAYVVLAALTALLIAAAGARAQAVPRVADTLPRLGGGAIERTATAVDGAGRAAVRAEAVLRAQARAHARTVELRTLRGSRTVRGALRRMWLAGTIDRRAYEDARGTLWRAQTTADRLKGARGAELQAAIDGARELAAARVLTTSRLPLVLLTIRRNVEQWARKPMPVAGRRVTFDHDPIVFRYVPGQGMQVHWLSTAGATNGIAHACLARPKRCPKTKLRRGLQRLVDLSSRRGGYRAWESIYRFGQGRGPWVSAMTQGTAIQALARGSHALHDTSWARAARGALGAFERSAPLGVRAPAPVGSAYLMYSFAPSLRILNGNLQAVSGLHDMAVLSGSARARSLFRSGDRALRATLAEYDTGAWSLYDLGGHESDLGYHRLTEGFLGNLCRRTDRTAYCHEARKLKVYLRQKPRIGIQKPEKLRPKRVRTIRWALSKVSDVTVALSGPTGRAVLSRGRLSRGVREVRFLPPRAGRYVLTITAVGLGGPTRTKARTLVVHKPKKRAEHRRKHATKRTWRGTMGVPLLTKGSPPHGS